jgi:hypothetical protein
MKPKPQIEPGSPDDDLLPEYNFDYSRAKPNRFAVGEQERVIILDPDVAELFTNSEVVNRVLRALIDTMPTTA